MNPGVKKIVIVIYNNKKIVTTTVITTAGVISVAYAFFELNKEIKRRKLSKLEELQLFREEIKNQKIKLNQQHASQLEKKKAEIMIFLCERKIRKDI